MKTQALLALASIYNIGREQPLETEHEYMERYKTKLYEARDRARKIIVKLPVQERLDILNIYYAQPRY